MTKNIMAQKDYYAILGVDKNASEEDIKKAYKKLCMQYHPDKWVNATKEEQKQAEDKFKDINEANSVLSDKQKRQNYDLFGSADGIGGNQGFNSQGWGFGDDDDIDPFDFFRSRHQRPVQGNDITVEVTITFREAFKGGRVKATALRQRPCSHCNGTGSADGLSHTCSHCGGTGRIRKAQQFGNTSFVTETTCPYCHGTGKEVTKECPHCHGEGVELYEEEIFVDVPVGVFDGARVTYPGKGEPAPAQGGIPGNLNVIFNVEPEKNFWQEGKDLIFNLELTLVEAWGGCRKSIEHLDGTKINVEVPPLTNSGARFVVKGKGFKDSGRGPFQSVNGNFVIEVNYKIPDKPLTKEQKDILAKFYD